MWKAVLMFPIPLGCDASRQVPMNNAVARVSLLHSCRRCHRSHLRSVEFSPIRNTTRKRRGREVTPVKIGRLAVQTSTPLLC